VTTIDPTTGGVFVSWSAPYNNGATISKYSILIYNKINAAWVEDIAYCDGRLPSIVASLRCLFPMSVIRDTYGYNFKDLVTAKLQAYNVYGWSISYSEVNAFGATVRVEPN